MIHVLVLVFLENLQHLTHIWYPNLVKDSRRKSCEKNVDSSWVAYARMDTHEFRFYSLRPKISVSSLTKSEIGRAHV